MSMPLRIRTTVQRGRQSGDCSGGGNPMRISGADFPEPTAERPARRAAGGFRRRRCLHGATRQPAGFPRAGVPDSRGNRPHPSDEYEPEDRFLGRLEEKQVQTSITIAVSTDYCRNDPQPTELHRNLLSLYPRAADIRIVTTNFDLLFEEVVSDLFDTAPRIFYAPVLPLGERLSRHRPHSRVGQRTGRE